MEVQTEEESDSLIQMIRDLSSETYVLFEHGLNIPGLNKTLSVLLGHCASGLFTAIPELGISCNLSSYDSDADYNEKQLIECGLNPTSAKELALYIENWLRCNARFMDELRTKNFNMLRKRIKMMKMEDI